MQKFYMIFGGYETEPTKKFATLLDAQHEAERLCQKHGKEFVILQAISIVRQAKSPVEFCDLV